MCKVGKCNAMRIIITTFEHGCENITTTPLLVMINVKFNIHGRFWLVSWSQTWSLVHLKYKCHCVDKRKFEKL
jgi:hypothetical protein